MTDRNRAEPRRADRDNRNEERNPRDAESTAHELNRRRTTLRAAGRVLAGVVVGLILGVIVRTAVRDVAEKPHSDASTSRPSESSSTTARLLLSEKITDLANSTCPVRGTPVPKGSKSFLVYNGLLVRFCCSGCDETFLEDPRGYLAKLQEAGADVPAAAMTVEKNPPVIDSMNGRCPIMDGEVKDRASAYVVHRGVRVAFCCPPCIDAFAENPDVYLAKAAESGRVPADRMPAGDSR